MRKDEILEPLIEEVIDENVILKLIVGYLVIKNDILQITTRKIYVRLHILVNYRHSFSFLP